VSEYRLIRTGTEKSKRFGAWFMVGSLRAIMCYAQYKGFAVP
jgi:hypothetical protein